LGANLQARRAARTICAKRRLDSHIAAEARRPSHLSREILGTERSVFFGRAGLAPRPVQALAVGQVAFYRHPIIAQINKATDGASRPAESERLSSSQQPALEAGAPPVPIALPRSGGWLARNCGGRGAFARSTCTCRSGFTSARHSPGRTAMASSHEGHVTRSFPPSLRSATRAMRRVSPRAGARLFLRAWRDPAVVVPVVPVAADSVSPAAHVRLKGRRTF
jgi:hypothetical protein